MNHHTKIPGGLLALLLLVLFAVGRLSAQYSTRVFDLKKASELYDERGYEQNKAISVDGRLQVASSNGNVSYGYPIATTTISGYPFNVGLNYCSSVGFTSWIDWSEASGAPYSRWNRFHQNRPAWIIGVNGFAVQVLATSSTYHCKEGHFPEATNSYDDRDLVWSIDGYDVCNRMEKISTTGPNQSHYVDMIRLLRDDGSLLELINPRDQLPGINPSTRADLFTGHYVVNSANAHGYGIVEYDSTYWPHYIKRLADANISPGATYPYIPRKLRYYSGDGLEYVFREWLIPYGTQAYGGEGLDRPDRFGGMGASPSVFYLEEINSNAGQISEFVRSRQFYPRERITLRNGSIFDPKLDSTLDSTRGRALVTGFRGHTISYGDYGLSITSMGRTTMVRFDTVSRSGDAEPHDLMPLGSLGYYTPTAEAIASIDEGRIDGGTIYESFVGYVTQIIDPEGRTTSFDYEPYKRRYINYNFPHANPINGADLSVTLKNYRLNHIVEPTAVYDIAYAVSSPLNRPIVPPISPDTSLRFDVYTSELPYWTNNIAERIVKHDRDGRLLTTTEGTYFYDQAEGGFIRGEETRTDNVDGTRSTSVSRFRRHILQESVPFHPDLRHTELYRLDRYGADTVTTLITNDSIVTGGNLWLPVREQTLVNGRMKRDLEYRYRFDTVRRYGGDVARTARYGLDIGKRITLTRSAATGITMLVDTTDFLHLPLIDTTLTRLDSFLLKFESLERYQQLRASGEMTDTWENAMYDPRVAQYSIESTPQRVSLPPVTGLERRQVTADSTGHILAGRVVTYSTAPVNGGVLTDYLYRGFQISDSSFGDGMARGVLVGKTDYTRNWGGNLPFRTYNANGASDRNYYESYSSPKLLDNLGHYRALGRIARNDDMISDTTLPNNQFFTRFYQKPIASEGYVRRYDSTGGTLQTDTTLRMQEYTFFGLAAGGVDENGFYSRFRYDRDGRLLNAWLPMDFPGRYDSVAFSGLRSIDLFGHSRYSRTVDLINCTDHDSTYVPGASETTDLADFHAGRPLPGPTPSCPCRASGGSKDAERSGLLESCFTTRRYTNNEEYTGVLDYTVDAQSPLLHLLSLDSAYLLVHVASVNGSCVHLDVNSPQLNFAKSFVFNCDINPPAQTGAHGEKGDGRGLLSDPGGEADGGFVLKIDLAEALPALRQKHVGESMEFLFHVSTVGGGVTMESGVDAEDIRPRLMVRGTYRTLPEDADYTLGLTHDDAARTAAMSAKIDDRRHTSNQYDLIAMNGRTIRHASSLHRFGADNRLLATIGDPSVPSLRDSTINGYTGVGLRRVGIDQEGDSVVIRFDADGRQVSVTNHDRTATTTSYRSGAPSQFGITDQDYYGFCSVKYVRDEKGVVDAEYRDAFDRLRKEVADTLEMKITTRYNYDRLGRLETAISPKKDTTRYSYDDLGRIRYKAQPDIGTVSYSYDAVGNVRFLQSQEQADEGRITFNEYDDLNRIVVVGEAMINNGNGGSTPWLLSSSGSTNLNRLTDRIGGDTLRDGALSTMITANRTLWKAPLSAVPTFWSMASLGTSNCALGASALLGETSPPTLPMLKHPAAYYEPTVAPRASITDFEHLAKYPHFPRLVVSYDRIPYRTGPVWGAFPSKGRWDSLAPTGRVRNGQGHEVAVAWREHGGEPYHYSVMSYDERGRVEALLRYSENLGFDAVYYRYNSMNQVTETRVTDPLHAHRTWRGYDIDGRPDSIWTRLETGQGLARGGTQLTAQRAPDLTGTRPGVPDIVYNYRPTDLVASVTYPVAGVTVDRAYNHRKWIDSIVARAAGGSLIFSEKLGYDSTGRVVEQEWKRGTNPAQSEHYYYDNNDRLTDWGGINSSQLTSYLYDRNGNRRTSYEPNLVTGQTSTAYSYGVAGAYPNRLYATSTATMGGQGLGSTTLGYDADGAVTARTQRNANGTVTRNETMSYSFRELMRRYTRGNGNEIATDWRYRYSPSGEREQKRLYGAGFTDAASPYPWCYYLLGGNREQLAVYHGQQISNSACGDPGRWVYFYPSEYLTYGVGSNAMVTTLPNGKRTYSVHDHLGSVRAVVDEAGHEVTATDYEPFGASRSPGPASTRKGFIDKERDQESDLCDLGVRKYDPVTGRFMSPDPVWEGFRSLTPYHYSRNDPMRRVDPSGMWDIIVVASRDRGRNQIADAYLVDRSGNVVYTFQVKVVGQHRNRMQTNGDTPFGVYDINDRSPWRSGGSRRSYGPNARLVFEPISGEAAASGRSAIRLHGGRQEREVTDPKTGEKRWVQLRRSVEGLPPTHGCLRALDGVMRELRRRTQKLEGESAQERPGVLIVTTPDRATVRTETAAPPTTGGSR